MEGGLHVLGVITDCRPKTTQSKTTYNYNITDCVTGILLHSTASSTLSTGGIAQQWLHSSGSGSGTSNSVAAVVAAAVGVSGSSKLTAPVVLHSNGYTAVVVAAAP